MNFFYRPAVALAPETGDPTLILRPEILVTVIGPLGMAQYRALIDTGADNTILPSSIANDLGITLTQGTGPHLTAFGGQKLSVRFGDVLLEIEDEREKLRWPARVQFFDFPSAKEEALVMGHAGFLDYFTATFDGELCQLTLVANNELPHAS